MSFRPGDDAGKRVSDEELNIILALRDMGYSYREIARQLGRSKNTIERVLNPSARERDTEAIYRARYKTADGGDLRPELGTTNSRRGPVGYVPSRDEIIETFYDDPYLLVELGFDSAEDGLEALEGMTNSELAELAF